MRAAPRREETHDIEHDRHEFADQLERGRALAARAQSERERGNGEGIFGRSLQLAPR